MSRKAFGAVSALAVKIADGCVLADPSTLQEDSAVSCAVQGAVAIVSLYTMLEARCLT